MEEKLVVRLENELNDLDLKLEKVQEIIFEPCRDNISKEEFALMHYQAETMALYCNILLTRIRLAKGEPLAQQESTLEEALRIYGKEEIYS